MAELGSNMVLRSVYLPFDMDEALRGVSFYERCAKGALVRHFVYGGLCHYFGEKRWLQAALAKTLEEEERGMKSFADDLERMRRSFPVPKA